MKIYYIEDINGKFISENGSRRFNRLCGQEAYDYLERNKGKRFMKTTTEETGGDEVFVEAAKDSSVNYRVDERREQYVYDSITESGYSTISLYACEGKGDDGDTVSGEELIADENVNVEEKVMLREDIKMLYEAIDTLTDAEKFLVYALFLRDKPMTEVQCGKILGITHQAVSKQKKALIEKFRNFFGISVAKS